MTTVNICDLLISNRDVFKSAFTWDSGLQHLSGAMIMTQRGLHADKDRLIECRNLIKRSFNVFSSFRGNALAFTTAMLATAEDPVSVVTDTVHVYKLLRQELYSSDYLAIAATVITTTAERFDYNRVAERTKEIYRLIKSEHPFLTSTEDTLYCALLALASRPNGELLRDVENCYALLKQQFLARNILQSTSHLLSLSTVSPAEKCERLSAYYEAFRIAGRRYGTDFELPSLAVLTMTGLSANAAAAAVIEADDYLGTMPGFGFFSSVSRKQRLMLAAAIVTRKCLTEDRCECENDLAIGNMMSLSVTCAILSAIIAQQQAASASST